MSNKGLIVPAGKTQAIYFNKGYKIPCYVDGYVRGQLGIRAIVVYTETHGEFMVGEFDSVEPKMLLAMNYSEDDEDNN